MGGAPGFPTTHLASAIIQSWNKEFLSIRDEAHLAPKNKQSQKLLSLIYSVTKLRIHNTSKTGIFAQRARVDQAVGLYYRKENLTF